MGLHQLLLEKKIPGKTNIKVLHMKSHKLELKTMLANVYEVVYNKGMQNTLLSIGVSRAVFIYSLRVFFFFLLRNVVVLE